LDERPRFAGPGLGGDMTGFQRLAIGCCVIVFALIAIGGFVRATDSGLGCEEWPRCNGSFIPEFEKEVLIEYSHRTTASITGLMVLSLAFLAWRSYRKTAVFLPAVASLALVIFQGALGGVTVLNELPPEIVTIHLATALIIVTVLLITATAALALDRPMPRPRVSPNLKSIALLAWANTFVLMLVGAFIAGNDYALACSGWPLCNGDVIPAHDVNSIQINFAHRFLALTLGIAIAALFVAARKRERGDLIRRLAHAALAVYVIQVLVGASNIWTEVAPAASTAHLAVGTLLWVILGVANIRIHRLHELLRPHSADAPDTGLAGATR
jgi:heme A synthase